jgi:hydrogenase-4 component B
VDDAGADGCFCAARLLIGVVPQVALGLVSPAIELFCPPTLLAALPAEYGAVLGRLSLTGVLLLTAVALVILFWRWRLRRNGVSAAPTWGCGYQRGTARVQYGATSFSEFAVAVFNGLVRQKIERPVLNGLFPGSARCSDVPTETLLDRLIAPLFLLVGVGSAFLRRLQHGLIHVYMMYIFATLFILMLWAH